MDFKMSLVGAVFLICGIGMLAFGMFLYSNNQEKADSLVTVTGVISDIETYKDSDGDRSHRVYVSYDFEGNSYKDVAIGYYSSAMKIGNDIELLCDPENPGDISSVSGMIFMYAVIGILGVVFTVVGAAVAFMPFKAVIKEKKIMKKSISLYGTVDRIGVNTNYTVNGECPWVLYAIYEDSSTGRVTRFKSDNLWFDPEYTYQKGDTVEIRVNPDNYNEYKVIVEERKVNYY